MAATHRFTVPRELSCIDNLDTLRVRLTDDLDALAERHGVEPDLVVVTGDLAEWSKRGEYEDVFALLVGVQEHLGLGRDRMLVLPGNHDINWAFCESYFKECEGDDLEPKPPFWKKWRQYKQFFDDFYATQAPLYTFEEARPWTLFEIPELKVVVAGLNSTMKESHRDEDHGGWLGEKQLRFFQGALETARSNGRLRIGAFHHNWSVGPGS